jgi:peptidoglycan/LPS O-acetylase OafA/YrhL
VAVSIFDSIGYDSMAIGALFALAYRRGARRLLRIARSPIVGLVFLAWIGLLAANQLHVLSLAVTPATSVLTGLFILNQIDDRKKLIDLERPGLRHLGRISFGVYVYNPLMITLLTWITRGREVPAVGIVLLVSAMTIAVASLSYRFLEKPFLRIKDRLAHVKTTA